MSHGPEHEHFLDTLAAGELEAASAEVQNRLRSCPMCAKEWKEIAGVQGALERRGTRFRAAAQAASGDSSAPGEERAERALREDMARAPSSRSGPSGAPVARSEARVRQPWVVLALAAVVLAIGAWYAFARREPPRPPRMLGREALAAREPVWTGAGELFLRWSALAPSGQRAWIAVQGRDTPDAPWREVVQAPAAMEGGWRAGAAEVAVWPPELRWRVEMRALADDLTIEQGDWSAPFRRP